MTAFDTALASLHADGNIGVAAVYTPAAAPSAPVDLRIVLSRPTAEWSPGQAAAQTPDFECDVMVADVAQPAAGDTIQVGAYSYVVADFDRDAEGLSWRLGLQAA